jgi:hypothetical protein
MLGSSSSASIGPNGFVVGAAGTFALVDAGGGPPGFATAGVGLVVVGPTFLSIVEASGEMLLAVRTMVGGAAADPAAGGAMPTTVMRFDVMTGLLAPVALVTIGPRRAG